MAYIRGAYVVTSLCGRVAGGCRCGIHRRRALISMSWRSDSSPSIDRGTRRRRVSGVQLRRRLSGVGRPRADGVCVRARLADRVAVGTFGHLQHGVVDHISVSQHISTAKSCSLYRQAAEKNPPVSTVRRQRHCTYSSQAAVE